MRETKWFGVKTLYRWRIVAPSDHGASDQQATADLAEERVLLVRAPSAELAIERAERNAKDYAATEAVNPQGNRIAGRYLGACDCFELFEVPNDRVEVFSSTELVAAERTDAEIVDARLGRSWPNESEVRNLFADRDFGGGVPDKPEQ